MGSFLLATWTLVGWGAVRIRVWDRMIWLRTGADFLICVFMLIWTFATIGAGWVVVTAIHTSHRQPDRRLVLGWLYSTGFIVLAIAFVGPCLGVPSGQNVVTSQDSRSTFNVRDSMRWRLL